jgi:hypothetical protein
MKATLAQISQATVNLFRRYFRQIVLDDGFGEDDHPEQNVHDDGPQAADYCRHSIWIEPEFVEAV